MTTDDPILRELSDADPALGHPDADASETERVLRYALSDGGPRRHAPRGSRPTRRPWLTATLGAVSVLVVAAIVVVVVGAGHRGGSSAAPGPGHSVTLIYRLAPTPRPPKLTGKAIDHELALIRDRLRGQPVRSQVTRVGSDEIGVTFSSSHLSEAAVARIELRVGASDSLQFYDWEANALLPSGATVASGLRPRKSSAIMLSQGTGEAPPGTAEAGGMTLYQAVKLASSQSAAPAAPKLSRLGPEYYSFGASRSRACATAALDRGTVPLLGENCYLAGPATTRSALRSELPRGVPASAAIVLRLPQGLVVVQASNQSGIGIGAAAARFFVLRDRVAVSGAQLIDPRASSEAGQPVVQFGFTSRGAKAFQSSTATISKRGETVSSGDAPLFQHFAVTFDGTLLTVPQIDFEKYPDGVVETGGRNGADIFAGSAQQTRRVVNALRLGPLPLTLQLVLQTWLIGVAAVVSCRPHAGARGRARASRRPACGRGRCRRGAPHAGTRGPRSARHGGRGSARTVR